MTSASSLLGAAGEHFVMSQLLRQGLIAALAPAGVPNCDIVVTDDIGERLCAVQVKTRRDIGVDGGWHMGRKHEGLTASTLFYCFVDFGRTTIQPPISYVVPASIVADVLELGHQAWLNQPGKNGKPRNDSDFRRFLPCYAKVGLETYTLGWLEKYREAWGQLKRSAEPLGEIQDEPMAYAGEHNTHRQILIEKTSSPGNHRFAKLWKLQCSICESTYGANSCDFHLRRCPDCQNGKAGIPLPNA